MGMLVIMLVVMVFGLVLGKLWRNYVILGVYCCVCKRQIFSQARRVKTTFSLA